MFIEQYTSQRKTDWDNFVLNISCNGTFLQTRKFLEYHENNKFIDNSLLFMDKEKIIAVLPAHLSFENNKKKFVSHNGSTYGGLIFNKKYYNANRVQEVINILESYFIENEIDNALLKITPKIFSKKNPALLEYLLTKNGYDNYLELSTYVDLKSVNNEIIMSFDETKRKIIRRLEKRNISIKRLKTDVEIEQFYNLLVLNLNKFGIKPVHTLNDILDFKNNRLIDEVEFYAVLIDEKVCSAGMMFIFENVGVAHAQNLSTNPNDEDSITITYLYYSMIKEYKDRGFKYLSWGKSTEEKGEILNFSLLRNKEAYGSDYDMNRVFFKDIKRF